MDCRIGKCASRPFLNQTPRAYREIKPRYIILANITLKQGCVTCVLGDVLTSMSYNRAPRRLVHIDNANIPKRHFTHLTKLTRIINAICRVQILIDIHSGSDVKVWLPHSLIRHRKITSREILDGSDQLLPINEIKSLNRLHENIPPITFQRIFCLVEKQSDRIFPSEFLLPHLYIGILIKESPNALCFIGKISPERNIGLFHSHAPPISKHHADLGQINATTLEKFTRIPNDARWIQTQVNIHTGLMAEWNPHTISRPRHIRIAKALRHLMQFFRQVFLKHIYSLDKDISPTSRLSNLATKMQRNRLCASEQPLIKPVLSIKEIVPTYCLGFSNQPNQDSILMPLRLSLAFEPIVTYTRTRGNMFLLFRFHQGIQRFGNDLKRVYYSIKQTERSRTSPAPICHRFR